MSIFTMKRPERGLNDMVLDGNLKCARMMKNRSFRVKKNPTCAGSRTNQTPYTGHITEIARAQLFLSYHAI